MSAPIHFTDDTICHSCGNNFPFMKSAAKCPKCGSINIEVIIYGKAGMGNKMLLSETEYRVYLVKKERFQRR